MAATPAGPGPRGATELALIDELWASLAPSEAGLVAAVIVHAQDQRVLMLGYMNREALAATLDTRKVTFFSRSKGRLWQKGESSGHSLELVSMRVDCDGDALLLHASPRGPTCHTGASSCFYKPVELPAPASSVAPRYGTRDDGPPPPALALLWSTILERKATLASNERREQGRSYVRSLLSRGVEQINAKILEEAQELCNALSAESDERVSSEAADLLFHALVGLAARDLDPASVAAIIKARHGVSGIDEKATRTTS